MTRWFLAMLACGCGDDAAVIPDAPPIPPTPTVTVTTPRLNEAFYMTDVATVSWQTENFGSGVACTVTASAGAMTFPIASAATATTAMWTLTTIPASNAYAVRVVCVDADQQMAEATSAPFAVTGPAQAVSWTTQILPLLNTCTGGSCHDDVGPQLGLDLSPSVARTSIVGISSRQCTSAQLVSPGNPTASYFLTKLRGNGPCMMGTRMPRGSAAFTPAQLQLVRDWITNGAPDN